MMGMGVMKEVHRMSVYVEQIQICTRVGVRGDDSRYLQIDSAKSLDREKWHAILTV